MKKILPNASKTEYRAYLLGYANAMLVFTEELGLNTKGSAIEVLKEIKREEKGGAGGSGVQH